MSEEKPNLPADETKQRLFFDTTQMSVDEITREVIDKLFPEFRDEPLEPADDEPANS